MATYITLNLIFFIFIGIIIFPFLTKLKVDKRVWFLLSGMLTVLTLIFDSLLIRFGIVAYDSTKISGLRLGLAPVEDFFYTLLAIIMVPSLWNFFDAQRLDIIRAKMKKLFRTLKKLFWVSRPISWPNTAYPFATGYLVGGGNIDTTFFIGTIFFLIPYNLLMYGINDVFDYESDILNPRKGGIEGMKEQKVFHPTIIKFSVISTSLFVVILIFLGNVTSNLILALLVFFVVAYSAKHLRFKEVPFLDSITSSIHFVGPLVFALSLNGLSSNAAPYLISFFTWGAASHAFGAVQDIIPDRSAKIYSIATWLGAKSTVRLSILLYSVSSIVLFFQGIPGQIAGLVNLLYVLNIYKYWNTSDGESKATNVAWRRFIWLNSLTGFVITLILLSLAI